MKPFKVIEVINANTVAVSPQWLVTDNRGEQIIDNKVKISGLSVSPNNEVAKKRLSALLSGKNVILVNPKIINTGQKIIECNVILENTDITYYFPDFSKKVAVLG